MAPGAYLGGNRHSELHPAMPATIIRIGIDEFPSIAVEIHFLKRVFDRYVCVTESTRREDCILHLLPPLVVDRPPALTFVTKIRNDLLLQDIGIDRTGTPEWCNLSAHSYPPSVSRVCLAYLYWTSSSLTADPAKVLVGRKYVPHHGQQWSGKYAIEKTCPHFLLGHRTTLSLSSESINSVEVSEIYK